jgi:hypothetical protein
MWVTFGVLPSSTEHFITRPLHFHRKHRDRSPIDPMSPPPNKAVKGGKLVRSMRFYCDADALLQGRTKIDRLFGLSRDFDECSPVCHWDCQASCASASHTTAALKRSNPNISTCLSGSAALSSSALNNTCRPSIPLFLYHRPAALTIQKLLRFLV